MRRVRLTGTAVMHDDVFTREGDVAELPDHTASSLVSRGLAVWADEPAPAAPEAAPAAPPEVPETASEAPKGARPRKARNPG